MKLVLIRSKNTIRKLGTSRRNTTLMQILSIVLVIYVLINVLKIKLFDISMHNTRQSYPNFLKFIPRQTNRLIEGHFHQKINLKFSKLLI